MKIFLPGKKRLSNIYGLSRSRHQLYFSSYRSCRSFVLWQSGWQNHRKWGRLYFPSSIRRFSLVWWILCPKAPTQSDAAASYVLCIDTVLVPLSGRHQYGGRIPAITSVLKFYKKIVNSSLEELTNINVILTYLGKCAIVVFWHELEISTGAKTHPRVTTDQQTWQYNKKWKPLHTQLSV